MTNNNFGNLYIVATPIGNLSDLSQRAIETLQQADLIAAEDTRHSGKLLKHFNIETRMFSLHEHNERERSEILLKSLKDGKTVALISDAGTPLISDPGFHLVREAREQGIQVIPIPGACAAIAALCASGLSARRFVFEGFLPIKKSERLRQLEILSRETRTLVFYEAPHRVMDLLKAIQAVFEEARQIVIARELTKRFETITAGTASELLQQLQDNPEQQQGEFVILIDGAEETSADDADVEQMLKVLLEELPLSQASRLVAKLTNRKKKAVYDLGLKVSKKFPLP